MPQSVFRCDLAPDVSLREMFLQKFPNDIRYYLPI